jgi:hypothetical protein
VRRALQEWKTALREVGHDELGPIGRRTDEGWRAAEDATMAAVRRSGRLPSRGRALRWVAGIAASLLLVALTLPWRSLEPRPETGTAAAAAARATAAPPVRSADDSLSAADRDDDDLLRDAAYLARGGGDGTDIALEESL